MSGKQAQIITSEEFAAMKLSLAGMSKQLDITIQTTSKILENYNKVIEHQNELLKEFKILSIDNRLSKNILNQLKSFFEKTFPAYVNEPHFVTIRQLGELLIDSSEEGIKKKIEFFEKLQKELEAKNNAEKQKG